MSPNGWKKLHLDYICVHCFLVTYVCCIVLLICTFVITPAWWCEFAYCRSKHSTISTPCFQMSVFYFVYFGNEQKESRQFKESECVLILFCFGIQDPNRACYGPKHVEVAHERMAIQTLLITDELFRLVIDGNTNFFKAVFVSFRDKFATDIVKYCPGILT